MKLLHMLYDLCSLYGDYANVLALKRALEQSGEQVEIDRLSAADIPRDIDFSSYDFLYIGPATEKNQAVAAKLLAPFRDGIKAALDGGTIMLAVGTYEIFGKSITDSKGAVTEGLDLFPYHSVQSEQRTVSDEQAEFGGIPVIGFINRCSEIYDIDEPFFTVKQGVGNSAADNTHEGVISGNFYGTHIIGPLLIRNPDMAGYFAKLLLERQEIKGGNYADNRS